MSVAMPRSVFALIACLLLPMLTGCLGGDAPSDGDTGVPGAGSAPLAIPLVDAAHDHLDPSLHTEVAMGLTVLSRTRVDEGPGTAPGIADLDLGNAGRMKLAGDLLVIASVRGTTSGLLTVDVTDPATPVALGAYRSADGASEGEGLAVTPDGRFAFVTLETAYSPGPTPPAIEVVDLTDPSAPTLAARIPTVRQPHVLTFFEADGEGYLIASEYSLSIIGGGVPGAVGLGAPTSTAHVGITIYSFDPATAALVEAAFIAFDPREIDEEFFFAHDPVVTMHPVTGERVLYLGAFGGGGRVYSLENPTSPVQLGYSLDKGVAPVLRHHSFEPSPTAVDGVVLAAAVPRSLEGDGPGSAYLSLYDTADPAAPTLLGQWRHPDADFLPGDVPPLNLHIPAYASEGTRLVVPHFHAGLFVFDVSSRAAMTTPTVVGYFRPGDAPDAGARAAGIVAAAIEKDGIVLTIDTASGMLYALQLDA